MQSGKKRKRHKVATHKRKKRSRAKRHKKNKSFLRVFFSFFLMEFSILVAPKKSSIFV